MLSSLRSSGRCGSSYKWRICRVNDSVAACSIEPKLPFAARAVVAVLTIYQRVVSPALPPACRYAPTCSEYMRQAVIKYGTLKGVWMGLKRLSRCHPFHPGGYDPVP